MRYDPSLNFAQRHFLVEGIDLVLQASPNQPSTTIAYSFSSATLVEGLGTRLGAVHFGLSTVL